MAAPAVQGPTSYSVLAAAGIENLQDMRPFDVTTGRCGDVPVTVSRTGYTGDLGYELWMDPRDGLVVWDAIFALRGQ